MAEKINENKSDVVSSNQIVHETLEGEDDHKKYSEDINDPIRWVQRQIENGCDPRRLIQQLVPSLILPEGIGDIPLWRFIFEMLSEPDTRKRLEHVNSIEHFKKLIKESKNIVVLTGAGVSVSCGIPDFRSRNGIYARLSKDYPDLPDPQAMFDIHYFRSNPMPFFKFAKEIYPGQFVPSLCHRFIAHLDKQGKLLRNYTQNIDTLEQVAGIKNIVQCHGSFASATCMNCKRKAHAQFIKADIFDSKIPRCNHCTPTEDGNENILKPDIVFFGESLSDEFHNQINEDKNKADLLIVIGSSLKVRPVALIPNLIKRDVPQVLINREPLEHVEFDVELYGNCDDVLAHLCSTLEGDWKQVIGSHVPTPVQRDETASKDEEEAYYVRIPPNKYVFHGAELPPLLPSNGDVLDEDQAFDASMQSYVDNNLSDQPEEINQSHDVSQNEREDMSMSQNELEDISISQNEREDISISQNELEAKDSEKTVENSDKCTARELKNIDKIDKLSGESSVDNTAPT